MSDKDVNNWRKIMGDGLTDAYRMSEQIKKSKRGTCAPSLFTEEANNERIRREQVAQKFSKALSDLKQVTDVGDNKHGKDSWKDKDNPSLQHMANCHSMFHHLAEHMLGQTVDKDSGMDPLLHLACRALMAYERNYRVLKEETDGSRNNSS